MDGVDHDPDPAPPGREVRETRAMPRAVPAVLLVLALASAPALTGCGGDDGATTEGAATTPPATTAPPATPTATTPAPTTTRTTTVPTTPAPGQQDPASPAPAPDGATTLAAPGSDPPPAKPAITEVQRPKQALYCPAAEGGAKKGSGGSSGFDARDLLGLSTAKAEALAKRNDCVVRVVSRDGKDLIRTMDFSNARVNVTETKGRIVALNGIG